MATLQDILGIEGQPAPKLYSSNALFYKTEDESQYEQNFNVEIMDFFLISNYNRSALVPSDVTVTECSGLVLEAV